MALELHHLHTDGPKPMYKKITADEYERLTARIDELQSENAELKEERRWRKFPDEKPGNGQEVLVWLTAGGPYGFVLTSRYIDSQWYYGEDPQGCKPSHWMPLPTAPKED